MNFNLPLPDAARQTLARLGTQIEYTEREPDGIVNLVKSEVTNNDLRHLILHPGFAALHLDKTLISDAGLTFVGEMSSLEGLRLYDTLISNCGLKSLLGLSRLERLNIGCDPG